MMKAQALLVGVIAVTSIAANGCTKKEEGAAAAASAASAAPASGCGADYADPLKEFCVKVPAGFTPQKPQKPSSLYSEIIDFDGPMTGFSISVGFTSSNWEKFDDQMKADEEDMADKDIKVDSSGKTAGTGKWWVYTRKSDPTTKQVKATVKSNGDKSIHCSPNNSVVKPEVLEACKTVRAYPK